MSTMAELLAEALLEHQIDLSALRRDRKATAGYWMACRCGFEWSPDQTQPDQHPAHLAEIQAELVEREIAAARGEVVARVKAECLRLAQSADEYDQAEQWEYAGGLREAAHHIRAALTPDPDREAKEGGR